MFGGNELQWVEMAKKCIDLVVQILLQVQQQTIGSWRPASSPVFSPPCPLVWNRTYRCFHCSNISCAGPIHQLIKSIKSSQIQSISFNFEGHSFNYDCFLFFFIISFFYQELWNWIFQSWTSFRDTIKKKDSSSVAWKGFSEWILSVIFCLEYLFGYWWLLSNILTLMRTTGDLEVRGLWSNCLTRRASFWTSLSPTVAATSSVRPSPSTVFPPPKY